MANERLKSSATGAGTIRTNRSLARVQMEMPVKGGE